MIKIAELKESDKGRWVEYKSHCTETGRIKRWNEGLVFVVYACAHDWDNFMNYTGCATDPNYLTFIADPEEVINGL